MRSNPSAERVMFGGLTESNFALVPKSSYFALKNSISIFEVSWEFSTTFPSESEIPSIVCGLALSLNTVYRISCIFLGLFSEFSIEMDSSICLSRAFEI